MSGDVRDGGGFDGSLEAYVLQFSRLNVNRAGGHASPHKACMLLAVLDLAEAGDLEVNEIRYVPALLDRYHAYFAAVRSDTDHPNSYFPYFHLKGEPFWHLKALDGRNAVLETMTTARRHRDILENIDYAELDDALHRLMQRPTARDRLRDVLISCWFPAREAAIRTFIGERAPENDAEQAIRAGESAEEANDDVRDRAFRRVVLEAYDYRCAASGMRLFIPGVAVLMDAAHLIPFAESRNDSPTNGMALTPNFHRALDRNLIAPGPDFKWHVSPVLDPRIRDYEPLLELNGRPVIFHGRERFRPSPEALEWRLQHLLTAE